MADVFDMTWSSFGGRGSHLRKDLFVGRLTQKWYNHGMNPKLSRDVEEFLSTTPEGALQVQGDTGATYWVLTEDAMQIRQQVLDGLAEAERGDLEPWDAESIKRAGRERLNERRQN